MGNLSRIGAKCLKMPKNKHYSKALTLATLEGWLAIC